MADEVRKFTEAEMMRHELLYKGLVYAEYVYQNCPKDEDGIIIMESSQDEHLKLLEALDNFGDFVRTNHYKRI